MIRLRPRLASTVLPLLLVSCGGKVAPGIATDAGATPPASCVGVDVTSDARHCGWCGHDCGGAKCSNSVCAPRVVSERIELPNSIAVDDAFVYFTSLGPGTVRRARKEGGGETTYASASDGAREIAVDDSRVYWVQNTPDATTPGAFFALKTGSPPSALPLGAHEATAFTVCNGFAWITTPAAHLGYCATPAGPPVDYPIDRNVVHLACARTELVWLDLGPDLVPREHAGRVVRFSYTGGVDIQELVGEVDRPARAVVVDGIVYFTSGRYTGLIQSVPLKGGPTATLASGQLDPQGIAVDDKYVYWVNVGQLPAEGTVMRADKRLGKPEFVAFAQRRPTAIAVDGTHVYWTAQGDAGKANGGVYRVPK